MNFPSLARHNFNFLSVSNGGMATRSGHRPQSPGSIEASSTDPIDRRAPQRTRPQQVRSAAHWPGTIRGAVPSRGTPPLRRRHAGDKKGTKGSKNIGRSRIDCTTRRLNGTFKEVATILRYELRQRLYGEPMPPPEDCEQNGFFSVSDTNLVLHQARERQIVAILEVFRPFFRLSHMIDWIFVNPGLGSAFSTRSSILRLWCGAKSGPADGALQLQPAQRWTPACAR